MARPTTSAPIETIEATFRKWIFNRDGSDFRVAVVVSDGQDAKVAGTLVHCDLGKTYRLDGRWENNKWGPTFKVVSAVVCEPRGAGAVEAYLKTLPGIGETSARAIVAAYGPELAISALEQDSVETIRERAGIRISAEKLSELRAYLDAERSSREVDLQVRQLLGDLATDKLVKKILDLWGDQAPSRIAKNPWSLTELPQVGFLKADAIAQRIGVDPESPSRIAAALDYVVNEARGDGHTKHRATRVIDRAMDLLGLGAAGRSIVDDGVTAAFEKQTMVELRGDFLATFADHHNEQLIASMLESRLSTDHSGRAFLDAEDPGGLYPDQVEALATMVAAGPGGTCLLTGAPGTGKTTMVRAFFSRFHPEGIALCAPTGKAAKRLAQQAKLPATTIHRLLEPRGRDDGSMVFSRNGENPIAKSLVVVDEASMVDAWLMRSLLSAIPRDCYLLIVGDPNQLPSVGPGCVLRDLIESTVIPHAELTQIKRTNPGRLLSAIHRVKAGGWQSFVNDPTSDLFCITANTNEECVQQMATLYLDRLPKMVADGDPIQDIQILVPWRAKDGLSARVVNEEIQRRRVIAGAVTMEGKWSLGRGDKVIQLKNDPGLGIVNGDQGIVLGIRQRCDKSKECPACDISEAEKHVGTVSWSYLVAFDGYEKPVSIPAIANDLDLSYAVTIHKAQGSEWPVIVLPTIGTQSPFYDRTLFYTALSRASKACVLVGRQDGLQRVVDRVTAERRETSLRDLLATPCH